MNDHIKNQIPEIHNAIDLLSAEARSLLNASSLVINRDTHCVQVQASMNSNYKRICEIFEEAQGVINQLELIDKDYKLPVNNDEIEATDECLSYENVSAVDTGGLTMKTCTNNQDHVPPIESLFYLCFTFLIMNILLLSVSSVREYSAGFVASRSNDYPARFMSQFKGKHPVYYHSYLHYVLCYTEKSTSTQSPVARSSFANPRKTAEDDRGGGGRELDGLFCRLTENAIFAIAVDKRETRDGAEGSIESCRVGVEGYLEGVDALRLVSVMFAFSGSCFGEASSMIIPTRDGRRIARSSKREENWSTKSVTWRLGGMLVVELLLSDITAIGGRGLVRDGSGLTLAWKDSPTPPTASDRIYALISSCRFCR